MDDRLLDRLGNEPASRLERARRRARRAEARPTYLQPREWAERASVALRAHLTVARVAFVAVSVSLAQVALSGSTMALTALIGWVVAGSLAWAVDSLVRADQLGRERGHRTAGTPSIAGWRLCAGLADLDAEAVLLLDLTCHLYERAGQPVRRPVTGHPRAGGRMAYREPLRAVARDWGRARGVGVRRSDRLVARLADVSVLRRVPIAQATAYRLACPSLASAIKTLEAAVGLLVRFDLGRDPTWKADDQQGR